MEINKHYIDRITPSIRQRMLVLLLLFICIPGFSNTYILVPGDTILANQLNLQAIELSKAKNYDSAILVFQKAAVEYKDVNEWSRFFYTQHTIGYLLNKQYRYLDSYHYLDSITEKYSAHLTPQLKSYQRFYGVIAWCQFNLLNYEKALHYFTLIDFGAEQNTNVTPKQILFSKYYQGVIYQRIGQYDQALKLMLFTKDLSHKFEVEQYLGMAYNNLGIIYRNLGEYERALEYYQHAIEMERRTREEINLTPLFNNLGTIYYYLKEYDAALREINYGLKVLTDYTSDYYGVESALINSKANVLIQLGEFKEAQITLEKVLRREIKSEGENWAGSTETLSTLGDLHSKIGEYEISNDYYDHGIAITTKILGKKNDKSSSNYLAKAENYLATNEFDKALLEVQYNLTGLVIEFVNMEVNSNPAITQNILSKVEVIETQYLKSKILLAKFYSNDDAELLNAALASNEAATLLVEKVRNNMLYESSKMNLSQRAKVIYNQTIEIAFLLEKVNKQPAMGRVFQAMEDSKAYILSESIEKARALGYSNLPGSVLAKEDSFRTKMKVLEAKGKNLRLKSKGSLQLSKIDQELFAVKESFEAYTKDHLETKSFYPRSLQDITAYQSQLSSDELVIEYFAGVDQLYAISISASDAKLYNLGPYSEPINKYVGSISKVQSMSAHDYQVVANETYRLLLEPILTANNSATQIVIIPDKQLGYIPFDALISEVIANAQYDDLAYLVKKYTFMQHQTVALYLAEPVVREKAIDEFIGFAPDFSNEELVIASNNQYRNELKPLPYAKKEVISISSLLNGEGAIGPNASETMLKERAASFNILHLATHAIIDEDFPLYSKLLFNLADSLAGDDGELHSYEIYGMKLNASLVTLSACNTGTGKYLEGEGIFSLGRSFLLAGAKSVLTSLWEVSDQSTSQIMESFYTHIKDGLSNPDALRASKLAYLKNADNLTANPHYWAAFIYIGQPDTVYRAKINYYWIGAFGLLFLGLSMVFLRAKKSNTPSVN